MIDRERVYQDNLQLAKAEYLLQQVYLRARPRIIGLVLSNRCNLGCIHCHQAKNGDSLLAVHQHGQAYIDRLESELTVSRQQHNRLLDQQKAPLVRMALRATRAWEKWRPANSASSDS